MRCRALTTGITLYETEDCTAIVDMCSPRAWAVSKAKDLDITGYAKNASNGTVVGEAQGTSDSVKQFVDSLYKAPSPAKVSKVESSDMQTKEGDKGFQR